MQLLIAETIASQETKRDFPVRGKYLSEEELRASIKGMFSNFTDYKKWVVDNNMVKFGYPLDPRAVYGTMTPIDEFFGNPRGTNRQYISQKIKEQKPWVLSKKRNSSNKSSESTKTKQSKHLVNDSIKENQLIKSLVTFLIERELFDTLKSILNNEKTSLQDAKYISNALLEMYESKANTEKFI